MAKVDLKKSVRELIQRNRYAKLITTASDGTPHGRIMTNLPLGEDMVLWYATGLSTTKAKEIKKNPTVSILIDDPSDQTYVSIMGKAEILTDSRLKKKFWQDAFDFFWPDGPSNPDYCLLKITPTKVEYLNPGPSFHANLTRTVVKL